MIRADHTNLGYHIKVTFSYLSPSLAMGEFCVKSSLIASHELRLSSSFISSRTQVTYSSVAVVPVSVQ